MATIPEYFATQRILPEQLPRASQQIVSAGQGIQEVTATRVAGQIAGVAGQIARDHQIIEARKQNVRDNMTVAALKGALDEFEFNSGPNSEGVETIEDFQTQEKEYHKAWDAEVQRIITGQNQEVSGAFMQYTSAHRIIAKTRYRTKSRAAERNWAMADLQKQWATRLKANVGNPEAAAAQLRVLVESYDAYLTPTQKQSLLADIDKSVVLFQKQVQLDGLHQQAKQMPYNQAIGMLNDVQGLTSAERNDLIRRRERQNEIETATQDSGVYWDTLRKLTNDPDSMTEPQIADLVKPNSLTTDDYKEFMGIKENAASPLKTPRAQLYFNSLDKLFDERETDAEERLNYDIANEKLMQFFKDNPKVTAKQAAEFYDELINPEVEGIFGKAFSFWLQSPFGILGRKALGIEKEGELSEPKTLEEFNVTVGGIEDEEKAKAYYEKWKNKW